MTKETVKTGLFFGNFYTEVKKIPDGSVDLIATDPPYGVDYVTNRRKYDSDVARPVNGDKGFDGALFEVMVREFHRILVPDRHVYIFGSDSVIDEQKRIFKGIFNFKNLLVWDKRVHTSGDLDGAYGKSAEFIIFGHKGRRTLRRNRPSSMISIPKIPHDDLLHSCQKPLALMAFLIENSTDPGEIVCDPFAGSGTTAIAALGSGRQFIGWENDSKTYDIAVKRISEDRMQMKLF